MCAFRTKWILSTNWTTYLLQKLLFKDFTNRLIIGPISNNEDDFLTIQLNLKKPLINHGFKRRKRDKLRLEVTQLLGYESNVHVGRLAIWHDIKHVSFSLSSFGNPLVLHVDMVIVAKGNQKTKTKKIGPNQNTPTPHLVFHPIPPKSQIYI